MSEKYLDVMEEELSDIRSMSSSLDSLSRAFYETGNSTIGDTLSFISEGLIDSSNNINLTISEEINNRLNESKKNVGVLLSEILNMDKK